MTLDVSRAMRPLTQLSSFISKQLNIIDMAVQKKTGKALPAFGGKGIVSEVQNDVKKWLKLIGQVDQAQAKIHKTRLQPVRVGSKAQARQGAERRVFGAFERAGGGAARVSVGDAGQVSKTFIGLMNNLTLARKELQQFSVSIRRNLVDQLGQASKSIIGQALKLKGIKGVTANTFNELWRLNKQFGDKSILTTKNYFAKGILVGQRGMEKFWGGIKKGLAFLPKKVGGLLSGLLGKLGQTGVGKGAAQVGGTALGGLTSIFKGMGGLGNITGMIGKISKALGPIGAIVSGIVKGVGLAKKAMLDIPLSIISKAASFALLPLKILSRIHSVIQSISFTVYILWSMISRTFREPLEVMKQVDVAMSIAEDKLTGVSDAMSKVMTYARMLPVPIGEIAKGFYEVVRSGFSAVEAMEILDAAMLFAVSTGGELNRAIDQIIGILRAFEMDVSKSAEIVSVLHKAVGSSRASLADLQIALGYAGPAALAAGLGFKEAVAMLTMFRDANLRASRAGMTFRAGLDAIQRAIGQATGGTMTLDKAVKHLGLAWEDMATEEGALNIKAVFREFGAIANSSLSIMDKLALRAIFQGRHWANWFKLLKMGNVAYEKRLGQLEREIDLSSKVEELNTRIWAIGSRLANVWTVFKMGIINEALPSLQGLNRFFNSLVSFMESSAKTIGRIIKSTISEPAMEFLERHLFPLFEGQRLTKEMERMGDAIKPIMRGMWEDLNTFLEPILEDVAGGEWTGPVVGGLQIMRALLRSSYTIVSEFYRFIKDKWAVLVEDILIVLKIITGIFEFLLPKAEALLTFALDAIIGLVQAIGELAGMTNAQIQEIQDNFRKLRDEAISGVKEFQGSIKGTGAQVAKEINVVNKAMRSGGEAIISGVPGFAKAQRGETLKAMKEMSLSAMVPPFGAIATMAPQVREQRRIWGMALEDLRSKLQGVLPEGIKGISGSTKRIIHELFGEIDTLMHDLNSSMTIAIRARTQDLESSVDSAIKRIKNEIESGLGTTKTKHEVEIKVTPSNQFKQFIGDLGHIMDFEELKDKVDAYSSAVAKRVVDTESAAYG